MAVFANASGSIVDSRLLLLRFLEKKKKEQNLQITRVERVEPLKGGCVW
jgi:hypothetical protein